MVRKSIQLRERENSETNAITWQYVGGQSNQTKYQHAWACLKMVEAKLGMKHSQSFNFQLELDLVQYSSLSVQLSSVRLSQSN